MASNTAVGDKPADPYRQANIEEVDVKTKVEELTNFMTSSKFGMMTTHEASTNNLVSRCMAIAATESNGIDLLFFSNVLSGKSQDLASDPHVNVSFIDASGQWASVAGQASIVTDRSLVQKHYSPTLKAWLGDLGDGKHDGSENDPRIGIIRVKMTTATYTLNAKNIIGRVAEIATGAVTGKPAAPNHLREVTAEDVATWRAAAS